MPAGGPLDAPERVHPPHLVDPNQPGHEVHHHDLHLKALLTVLQLLQELLREIYRQTQRDACRGQVSAAMGDQGGAVTRP